MEEKKLENSALNIMLANHLLCHSTYTKKLKCLSSTSIDFKLANAVLPQTEEKFLVSEQGITLASAHNFQMLKNSQFNEGFMCYLHSLQTLSSTQAIITPLIIKSVIM